MSNLLRVQRNADPHSLQKPMLQSVEYRKPKASQVNVINTYTTIIASYSLACNLGVAATTLGVHRIHYLEIKCLPRCWRHVYTPP